MTCPVCKCDEVTCPVCPVHLAEIARLDGEVAKLRAELESVRETLSYACSALDTEGLDETADRLLKQGGARKLP